MQRDCHGPGSGGPVSMCFCVWLIFLGFVSLKVLVFMLLLSLYWIVFGLKQYSKVRFSDVRLFSSLLLVIMFYLPQCLTVSCVLRVLSLLVIPCVTSAFSPLKFPRLLVLVSCFQFHVCVILFLVFPI